MIKLIDVEGHRATHRSFYHGMFGYVEHISGDARWLFKNLVRNGFGKQEYQARIGLLCNINSFYFLDNRCWDFISVQARVYTRGNRTKVFK